MASPSDPDEVEPTLLPGAAPQGARAEAPVAAITPPPTFQGAPDATLAHPVTIDADATLDSAAEPAARGDTNNDVDVTQVASARSAPDAGTVIGSNVAEPGATLPSPPGRTVASGAISGGISGDLSHDTAPISVSTGPSVPSLAPQMSGTMVGRFALRGLHASGGLGEVFTARDTELNREVAVKRIKSRYADDPGSRRRFLTEAELTARLDHPGVVPVFGLVNDARGRPVYAMRFIRGETLKDEIDRYYGTNAAKGSGAEKTEKTEKGEPKSAEPSATPAPETSEKDVPRTVAFRNLLSRFVYVCKAIAYAHDKGIIHRDIKPANVMVGKFGEVLVVDWGLAKSLSDGPDFDRIMRANAEAGFRHDPEATDLPSHMTMAGTAVGTPSYMPPEQAAGELDKVGPRADVYSLGATLFVILAGRAPFVGKSALETIELVRRGTFDPPGAVNAECPKPLDAICRKAMALNQNDRYATALDLAADVERWLSDEPVSAYRDPLTARLARWARRHPARIATGVSLLIAGVLAAGGIAWAVNEGRKSTQKALDLVTEKEKETAAERDKVTAQEKETAKALVQVTKEKEKTEAEKVRVGLARDVARSRYEKAVDAYNTLVHDIDKKLADRAGMQAIRKTLLLNATDGLRKLIEGKVEGDIGADRTLVSAHRQMGEVYQLVGETTQAREQFLEAVKVARDVKRLAAETSDARTPEARATDLRAADRDLARSLDKLAGIHVQAGDTKSALGAINEAVTIFEALAADKTDAVAQQDLAAALARRSQILKERGEIGNAVEDCQRALGTRKELSEQLPASLDRQRDFADSLDALAGLQLHTGDTVGANESAVRCLKLRGELASQFPRDRADVRREIADAHARLGEVHFDRALMSAAAKDYDDGVRVLDELIALDPQNASAAAGRALLWGRLGYVQIRTGDLAAALTNTKKGKEACLALEAIDSKSAKAQRDLALARQRHGDALLANGYTKDALAEYEASFASLKALQELDTESAAARFQLAHGWEYIGDCKLALKDPKGAVIAFQKGTGILEELGGKDEGCATVKRALAVTLYKQADAHCAEGKPVPANKLASRSTKMLVDLAAANPGSAQAQRDIALAYGKWGQVLANDGHPTGALIVWQSSLDRFQKLARLDEKNFQAKEEEATAWERLAGFYATLGNGPQALASARSAITLWLALKGNADTRTKAGQRRLALALIRCGDINAEIRQLSTAKDWYEQALSEVQRMKDDPLLGPVAQLANEKLVFLEAVKVGLSNPQNLADKKYDATRIMALRMVATLEVRADHPPEAANVAYELERYAKAPEDLFAVAHTFAGCAAASRGTDSAKTSDAKKAVTALRKAIDAGFRDADALTTPEWEAVNRRDPDFAKVREALIQQRSATKN
ncbi:Serine/threonine-protein kinase PknD [Gemmata sp. SH-PL17]|uniref:protein kinase domain-containing protein n=1 Tax=Gemmata sp. SH-PL17 TaxID=1630693 RepID=UPI00078C4C8B|nr:protein kinase [Gemmata sp. SH-PL17]AMV30454.1 Serine/threonine-protein kinase PknD [Gemmata sp. SH-PL17]